MGEISHIESHGMSTIIIRSWIFILAEREVFTFFFYKM